MLGPHPSLQRPLAFKMLIQEPSLPRCGVGVCSLQVAARLWASILATHVKAKEPVGASAPFPEVTVPAPCLDPPLFWSAFRLVRDSAVGQSESLRGAWRLSLLA